MVFLDLETTGLLHNSSCEIVTAYFAHVIDGVIKRELELFIKPDLWSNEAQKVHKIAWEKARYFPSRKSELKRLCDWMPKGEALLCYARNTGKVKQWKGEPRFKTYGQVYFDFAALKLNFNYEDMIFDYYKYFPDYNQYSVYDLVKSRLPKLKSKTQSSVYKHLFNETYNAHDAKDDVKAMIRIYNEIK